MGDWTLVIQGTGPHHNNGASTDADALADEAAQRFLESGHRLYAVEFTSGSRLNLPLNKRSKL